METRYFTKNLGLDLGIFYHINPENFVSFYLGLNGGIGYSVDSKHTFREWDFTTTTIGVNYDEQIGYVSLSSENRSFFNYIFSEISHT